MNLTLAAMIATLQYGSINVALGRQESLGLTALFFAASVLIEAIGLTVKTISMTFTSGSQSA